MKLHKIRNVPLDVCCAEQKVAYNMAFCIHINRGDEYLALSDTEKPQAIERMVEDALTDYRNAYTYQPGKCNEEAIAMFLKNGLAKYLEDHFIATGYEKIGSTFS